MTHLQKQQYAQLIIRKGLNLREGQCLLINTGAGTYEYAQALAQAAYQVGAKFVSIRIQDPLLTRFRIEDGKKEFLDYLPDYVVSESYEFLANDWARIRIDSTEERDLLSGLDSSLVDTVNKTLRTRLKRTQESLMRDQHPWLVTCAPGPRWASWIAKTLGLSDEGSYERLEEAFIRIMRLDKADPIAAWEEHIAAIGKRCEWLNSLELDAVHFVGEGTDLTVGLCKDSVWRGGSDGILPDGRPFVANMPTEEVYTTPDYRRSSGTVRCVRPVSIMETLVQDAWFRFEEGRVVDFGAGEGRDILAFFLDSDPGARFLGEVALVGVDSPIFQSGMIFGSILYDENASCHIALGAGYPSCLKSAASLSSAEATKAAGCNVSVVHTDFMIGNQKTNVFGIQKDGTRVQIQRDGTFLI